MKIEDIEKRALDYCKEKEIESYPVNIVNLCKSENISVFEKYLPPDVSGFIVTDKEKVLNYDFNKVIVVNLSDNARRRRFTIAHELAHYILHRNNEDELFAHRDVGNNSDKEIEANTFASVILMPEYLVKEALDDLIEQQGYAYSFEKVDWISSQFAVSFAAAEVRLKKLKLI